jgi:GTP-binding protein
LIEGASSGAGLGHAFLRHVERTRVLVHVVDGSARDPEWDFDVIREELKAHDPTLLDKPTLVAFNKVDLPSAADAWPAFRAARAKDGLDAVSISAATGDGMAPFRAALAALLPSADELDAPPEPSWVVVHRLDADPNRVSVTVEPDGAFRVAGRRIERLAAQTDFEVEESAERFQRDLARLGADEQLRKAGIEAGDTVRIGLVELEWEAEPWAARR